MDIGYEADQLIARLLEAKKPTMAADGKVYRPNDQGRFKDAEGTWYVIGQEKTAVPVKNFAGTPHQEDKAGRYVKELLFILHKAHYENKREVVRTKNLNMRVAPDKLRKIVVRALEKLPPKDMAFLASCYRVTGLHAVANHILRIAAQTV